MTRDQINQLWTESASVADFLIAIGVVKVDEPKSASDRLVEQLEKTNIGYRSGTVIRAIEEAGLMLVDHNGPSTKEFPGAFGVPAPTDATPV